MATSLPVPPLRVPPAERRTVRCENCRLMQFETASGDCRKCSKPLFPAPPVAEHSETTASDHAAAQDSRLPVDSLSTRLRTVRNALGLSQRQLASRISVPRTYISKLERGHATPGLASLKRVAAGLDTTPARLLGDPVHFDNFVSELAQYAPQLTQVQRDFIVAQVRGLVKANRPSPRSHS